MWELGVEDDGVYLAAQVLGPFPFILGAIRTVLGEEMCVIVDLGGSLGYYAANVQPPPHGHPHFPFGFAVEPD